MRTISLLVLLLLAVIPMAADMAVAQTDAPGRKTTAAILDLESKGVSETEAGALSDRLRFELFQTGAFDMMERGKMQDILKEQGFQQSGACNTDACAVEVGQLIGVEKMIAGSLGKVGKTYTVGLRMIDVRTGRVEQSVAQDYTGEIDKLLTNVMRSIAQKMAAVAGVPQLAQGALPKPASEGRPIYKKWWFWGGIGGATVGGVLAVVLGGKKSTEFIPEIPVVETLPKPPDPPPAPTHFSRGAGR